MAVRGVLLLLGRIASEVLFAWFGILLVHESLTGLAALKQVGGAVATGLATSSILRSQGVEVAGLRVGVGPVYERWTRFLDRHLSDISAESQSRQIQRLTEQVIEHGVPIGSTLRHRLLDHIQHNDELPDIEKWKRTDTIKETLGDEESTREEKARTIVGHALRWGMHRTLREVMVEARGTIWQRMWNRVSGRR